jgi:hypothetical protein
MIDQMECLKEILHSPGEESMYVDFVEIPDEIWQHNFSFDYHAVVLRRAIHINYRKISEIC